MSLKKSFSAERTNLVISILPCALACILCVSSIMAADASIEDVEQAKKLHLQAYNLSMQAQKAKKAQDWHHAMQHYKDTAAIYEKLLKTYPEWQTKVVQARLADCRKNMDDIRGVVAHLVRGPGGAETKVDAPDDQRERKAVALENLYLKKLVDQYEGQLKRRQKDHEVQVAALQEKIETIQKAQADEASSFKENQKLKDKIVRLLDQTEKYNFTITQLNEKLLKVTEDNIRLNADLAKALKGMQSLKDQEEAPILQKKQLDACLQENKDLIVELDQLRSQREQERAQAEKKLEETTKLWRERYDKLLRESRSDRDGRLAANKKLQHELHNQRLSVEKQVDILKKELEAEIDFWKTRYEDLKKDIEQREREVMKNLIEAPFDTDRQGRDEDLPEEYRKLIESLDKENSGLKKKVIMLQVLYAQQEKTSHSTIQTLRAERQDLERELRHKEQLAENEKTALRTELATTVARWENYRDLLKTAEQIKQALQEENRRLRVLLNDRGSSRLYKRENNACRTRAVYLAPDLRVTLSQPLLQLPCQQMAQIDTPSDKTADAIPAEASFLRFAHHWQQKLLKAKALSVDLVAELQQRAVRLEEENRALRIENQMLKSSTTKPTDTNTVLVFMSAPVPAPVPEPESAPVEQDEDQTALLRNEIEQLHQSLEQKNRRIEALERQRLELETQCREHRETIERMNTKKGTLRKFMQTRPK